MFRILKIVKLFRHTDSGPASSMQSQHMQRENTATLGINLSTINWYVVHLADRKAEENTNTAC